MIFRVQRSRGCLGVQSDWADGPEVAQEVVADLKGERGEKLKLLREPGVCEKNVETNKRN